MMNKNEEPKMPSAEEERDWLAELAEDNLRLTRCPHCLYKTLYGYLCAKCGRDTGK